MRVQLGLLIEKERRKVSNQSFESEFCVKKLTLKSVVFVEYLINKMEKEIGVGWGVVSLTLHRSEGLGIVGVNSGD